MAGHTYAPQVEQWRPLVQKYFPSQYVDEALWVINWESGGDPHALGDGGVAIGLFQIQDNTAFSNRPDAQTLLDPEQNIKYAALSLGGANGDFRAWGAGTENDPPFDPSTGQGRFGALGNHPYTPVDPNAGDISFGIPGGPSIDVNNIPGVGDAIGGILSANKNIVSGVTDAASGTLDIIKKAGSLLTWLLDPHHWFRLFFIGAGVVLVLAGGYIYVRGDKAISDATSLGKVAAAE